MAKSIRRTVRVYKYDVLHIIDDDDGKKVVNTVESLTLLEKLGDRKISIYLKDHYDKDMAYVMCLTGEEDRTYAMPVETFLEHATEV